MRSCHHLAANFKLKTQRWRGSQKDGFQKGGFGGCSPGTKTGTRARSPNLPFTKPPFYLPVRGGGIQSHFLRSQPFCLCLGASPTLFSVWFRINPRTIARPLFGIPLQLSPKILSPVARQRPTTLQSVIIAK